MPAENDAAEPGKLTRNVWVRNVSHVHQGVGYLEFGPGQALEVSERQAGDLVKLEQFEYHIPGAESEPRQRYVAASPTAGLQRTEFAKEFRRALQPNPPTPEWIANFNREVFPCQTTEFDPIPKADKPFSVTFRSPGFQQLNGGIRVILHLAGYLTRRGHGVTLSAPRSDILPEDLNGLSIRLEKSREIKDADIVVGTYWPTLLEVSRAPVTGQRVGLIQGDEPSWPMAQQWRLAAKAFSLLDLEYIAVCKDLAQTCVKKYRTPRPAWLPGNGVDIYDFSPRINNFEPRNSMCFIHRNVWWKGDNEALTAARMMQEKRPSFKALAASFERWSQPGVECTVQASIDDMALLYSSADFYVSFSRFEGSPLPPLEAMACGCIPLVTPIGVGDYLRDGENGFLIDPDKPEAAVDLMLAILSDDKRRRRMIQECLRTARARPWRMVCEAFESFIAKHVRR